MLWTLLLGLATGLLAAVPLAVLYARRTEQRARQLEQRARTAERLAELGTMTSGLAHEIKNPLSTVNLNLQLLQEDLTDLAAQAPPGAFPEDQLGRFQRRFDSLRRETGRLRDILEDFLRFAGRMELHLTPTDLNATLDELADFFGPQAAAAGVQLRTQFAANPAIVNADTGLLKQAVLNLLLNATQAMQEAREKGTPHGGATELILRTERARHAGVDEVQVHVIDTGPGVPDDVAARIFQPYFTTKRGGTGLGLPTARRIVEEHGGRLTLHTEPARGTDFRLSLPAAPGA